jgi:hypothetical protein
MMLEERAAHTAELEVQLAQQKREAVMAQQQSAPTPPRRHLPSLPSCEPLPAAAGP